MLTIDKLRKPKILDMAIFDWVATALAAAVIGGIIRKVNPGTSYGCASITVFVILILIAIVVHYERGIPTMLNAYLGIARKEDVFTDRK